MNPKHIISLVFVMASMTFTYAQTTNEKVGAMLNGSKWFELREFYETNTDSVMPFLDSFAKTMLGHFFNNPEQTLTYGADLLNNHSSEMGLGNVVSIGNIMGRAFYKTGNYTQAANILESITAATKQYLDSATVAGMQGQTAIYKSLSPYTTYQCEIETHSKIPFNLRSVGPRGKESYALMLSVCKANGIDCSAQFDTGAGVNVISDSLCNALNAKILDGEVSVFGKGRQLGRLAIIETLELGNITIHNVPFYVTTIDTGNSDANQYTEHLQMVLGIELMNLLRQFTIDFENNVIKTTADIPLAATPNMCFNNLSDISVNCTIKGIPTLLTVDTGDASFGYLNAPALPSLRTFIPTDAKPQTLRMAGFGGTHITTYYDLPNVALTIGDTTVDIPNMPYLKESDTTSNVSGDAGNIGTETFMLYKKVAFDMQQMVMWPTK